MFWLPYTKTIYQAIQDSFDTYYLYYFLYTFTYVN